MKKSSFGLLALAVLGSAVGQASTFSISGDPSTFKTAPGGYVGINNAVGKIQNLSSSFDTQSNVLSWSAKFGSSGSNKVDSFWLVLSPGPNPKGNHHELAIFYFDASQSLPTLTAYAYNGQNAETSYITPNDRINSSKVDSSWIKSLTVQDGSDGSRTLGFRVDATAINNHKSGGWTGAQYGNNMGIWFHPMTQTTSSYKDGYLTDYKHGLGGYVDAADVQTVPEPATMAVIGLGLAFCARRKKSA